MFKLKNTFRYIQTDKLYKHPPARITNEVICVSCLTQQVAQNVNKISLLIPSITKEHILDIFEV